MADNVFELEFGGQDLKHGAGIWTIAHAMCCASDDMLAALLAWDGDNLLLNDMEGTLATISFHQNEFVAVFFSSRSNRNPITSAGSLANHKYLRGAPPSILKLAEKESFEYMMHRYQGREAPIITSAFWGDNSVARATEVWSALRMHGGDIVEPLLGSDTEILSRISEDYELTDRQLSVVMALARRSQRDLHRHVTLTEDEKSVFLSRGTAGIETARTLLRAVKVSGI